MKNKKQKNEIIEIKREDILDVIYVYWYDYFTSETKEVVFRGVVFKGINNMSDGELKLEYAEIKNLDVLLKNIKIIETV